jgi:hypothetical protein
MWNAKVEINPLVRLSRDQIANTIYISNTRRDPLVAAGFAIANCPYVLWICSSDNFQVLAESLKTYAAPNIEMCFGMTIGLEVLVKSVFVKGVGSYQDAFLQHGDNCSFQAPTFVTALNRMFAEPQGIRMAKSFASADRTAKNSCHG